MQLDKVKRSVHQWYLYARLTYGKETIKETKFFMPKMLAICIQMLKIAYL